MAGNSEFLRQISGFRTCLHLFEHIPDVVFHIKDLKYRYQAANPAFARSVGLRGASQVLGKCPQDLFPRTMANVLLVQDRSVFTHRLPILDNLTLIDHDGESCWYLTSKFPLFNAQNELIGLAGIDRDLGATIEKDPDLAQVGKVLKYIQHHLDQPLTTADLVKISGLSTSQLERRILRLFRISLNDFVRRERINRGAILLRTTDVPVVQIAFLCGYGDQTSFTRQFRSIVGMPPAAYRARMREDPSTITSFVVTHLPKLQLER